MKDFKQNVKMMCAGGHYKEGGDVKQDKQMIKKAFKMHDDQLHEKKHTDLSKLKTGGKVKKMAEGRLVDDIDFKNAKPVKMPSGVGRTPTMNIDGKDVEVRPVQMPTPRLSDLPKTANRPDDLVYRYAPGQGPSLSDWKRGAASGMKKGGKTKLGKK